MDFAIEREIRSDFTFEKSVLRVDYNLEIQIRISWISSLPLDWEIRKRICKTVLVNSGLFLLIMRVPERPLFLRTVFQIVFRISQSNGKKENPKTDISALKSVFEFRV